MATKVAIACQGGGSQTAFTAGVLRTILGDSGFDQDYEVVALSGTSGGGICCFLTWYGLLTGRSDTGGRGARAAALLQAFWEDNEAHDWWDAWFVNPSVVALQELHDAGWVAQTPMPRWIADAVSASVKDNLRRLLERGVDMQAALDALQGDPDHPTLLVGAVDVLTGEFAVFEEACPDLGYRRQEPHHPPKSVSLDPILASASVPPLMRGQVIGTGCYWDGLFAHNPPIRTLVDRQVSMRPDEIWVIQIDPEDIPSEPTAPAAIVDRRFELSSNLSLNAELHWIKQINQWIHKKILSPADFKTIKIGHIRLGADLAREDGLASKVNRSPAYLRALTEEGERSTARFLRERAGGKVEWDIEPEAHQPRVSGRTTPDGSRSSRGTSPTRRDPSPSRAGRS